MKMKRLGVLFLLLLMLCSKEDVRDDIYDPGDDWIECFTLNER